MYAGVPITAPALVTEGSPMPLLGPLAGAAAGNSTVLGC
jgi:hypothetical protein